MKQYLIFSRCPFGFLTTLSLRNYFETTSTPPSTTERTQDSERDQGKILLAPIQKQKWKTKTLEPDLSVRRVEARSLNAYNWKQCLSEEVLSPIVLLAITSVRCKLNWTVFLNLAPGVQIWLFFFSTWRNSETYVHFNMTITPPLPNQFSYAFCWHPFPKSVRTLWMPVSAEYLSKKAI